MHYRRLSPVLPCLLAVIGSTPAHALDFTFLSHPDLIGHITFDAFLGNADDQYNTGLNSIGAASQFAATNTTYGYLAGTMKVQGVTPFGLQERQYFGNSTHISQTLFGEWNSDFLNLYYQPFTQSHDSNSASVISLSPDQSYTTSFVLHDSAYQGRLAVQGVGHYLTAFQAVDERYSGDLALHFETVLPLLPAGWAGVAQESQHWQVLDGPQAGVTGFTTSTFYTMDFAAIPNSPTPTTLEAPWQTSGYVAVAPFAESSIVIGSPDEPAIAGAALLAGGASVEVSSVGLGGVGDGTLTVADPGTELRVPAGVFTSEGDGALNVVNGARLSSGLLARLGTGLLDVHVDGAGSVLELQSSQDGSVPGLPGITGIIDVGSPPPRPNTITVTDGGHIDIIGHGNVQAVFALMAENAVLVDGADSRIRIQGASDGSDGRISTSAFLETGSTITVSNGASLELLASNVGVSGIALGGLIAPGTVDGVARLLVDGAGSEVIAGPSMTVGEQLAFDPTIGNFVQTGSGGGRSVLTVRNGATVSAEEIVIGESGTLNGSGGTLMGDVINRGVVALGESPGIMTIDGDFVQTEAGRLVIEIGGTQAGVDFDLLIVNGTLQLGGTLEIVLLDGFMPDADDSFVFLNATQVLGSFAQFALPTLADGSTLALHFGAQGVSAGAAPVPLPASVWTLGAAVALLARRRRQTQRAIFFAPPASAGVVKST